MLLIHKRLICTVCAVQAALCMAAVPVRAEVCPAAAENACVLSADRPDRQAVLTMLADDESEKDKKDESKSTLKEKTKNSWQIYACIGGGVLVVVAIISLLADKKKK